MRIVKVIPRRFWLNNQNGQRASVYGSVPWVDPNDEQNWTMVTQGWTWLMSNGTIGFGRKPADDYDEAVTVMEEFNARS